MSRRNSQSDFDDLYLACAEALDKHHEAALRQWPQADLLLVEALFLWDEVAERIEELPLSEMEKNARLATLATCRNEWGLMMECSPTIH